MATEVPSDGAKTRNASEHLCSRFWECDYRRAATAIAILTTALGIGATTAIFSVVDATLLHPLPYPHPEELVRVEFEEFVRLEAAHDLNHLRQIDRILGGSM